MKPIYKPSKTMLPTSQTSLVLDDEEGKESKDGLLLPLPAVHRREFLGRGRRLGSRTHCVATVAITISILCLASCVLIGCLVYFRLAGLTAATEKLAAPGEVCLPCAQLSPHPLDPDVTAQTLLQTLETRYQASDEDRASPDCCASTPGQYAALFKLVIKRQEEVRRLAELFDPLEPVEGSNLPQGDVPSEGINYDYGPDPPFYDESDNPPEDATDAPEDDSQANDAENDDAANDDDTANGDDAAAADDDTNAAADGTDAADDETDAADDVTDAADDDTDAADDDDTDADDDDTGADDDTAAEDTAADADDGDNDDDDANVEDVEDDGDDNDDSPAESSSSGKFTSANKFSSVSAHLVFKPPTDPSADKGSYVQWKSPAESVLSYIRPGLLLDPATQTTINVTSGGHYFVYCQMLYGSSQEAATDEVADGEVVSSYVQRRSLTYPASSGILLKTRHTRHDVSKDRHSSYVAGLFYLHAGDQLYVSVSQPAVLSNDDGASFFGLFKVE